MRKSINFNNPLVVKTASHADYHLGTADADGVRTVIRKRNGVVSPLKFDHAILFGSAGGSLLGPMLDTEEPTGEAVVGSLMVLQPIGMGESWPEDRMWFTTEVVTIENE